MDQKRQKLTPRKTKKKMNAQSTPKIKSHPSNPLLICNKEVVIQLERLSDSVVTEMTTCGSTLPPEQTKKRIKLSTPKAKSSPSYPQFICDKEVVVQLERVSDSFVAGMTAKWPALPPEQVNESNDDALDINSLPDEMILEIFEYLKQKQLGQIARVCSRWNVLTRSPSLWKNLIVKISPSHRSQTTIVKSLINRLPSCVTFISLDFTKCENWIEPLHFVELCMRLQEKCPDIKAIILTHYVFSNSLPSVIDTCTQFLQGVKYLIFRLSKFPAYCSTDECFGVSNIEFLQLLGCEFNDSNKPPFSKMPNLKQLHLFASWVEDSLFEDDTSFLNQLDVLNLGFTGITTKTFLAIQNHGHNLTELYICGIYLQDNDLNFNNSVFPHLETICLSSTRVTCEGVVYLIQSCPSLQNVYVSEVVAESFAAHPFVIANRCISATVKAVVWGHIHK